MRGCIRATIVDFDDSEKRAVKVVDSTGRMQDVTLITATLTNNFKVGDMLSKGTYCPFKSLAYKEGEV